MLFEEDNGEQWEFSSPLGIIATCLLHGKGKASRRWWEKQKHLRAIELGNVLSEWWHQILWGLRLRQFLCDFKNILKIYKYQMKNRALEGPVQTSFPSVCIILPLTRVKWRQMSGNGAIVWIEPRLERNRKKGEGSGGPVWPSVKRRWRARSFWKGSGHS